MVEWGIWEMIAVVIALLPATIILWYIFPRKSIKNYYIQAIRDVINPAYPKVVRISFTNHTNEPMYILSEGFRFTGNLHPSPNGAHDAATGVYEVKFEGRINNLLSEIDTLIRPGQIISTWVPVEPGHTDAEIDAAINNLSVGMLRLKCQKISNRRHATISLRIHI
jgi:hypothetical protein